jgi:thymidylate synthase
MNKLDKTYQDLLQDILDNGVTKQDRTGTGTISVFGRQIRHKMSTGFPLLTSKRIKFDLIVTELLWFLRGDTNIKYLVDNGCNIWNGDCYKSYEQSILESFDRLSNDPVIDAMPPRILSQEEFINKIKTNDTFAKEWGDLGPIYGKQWRSWGDGGYSTWTDIHDEVRYKHRTDYPQIDQIQNLINNLKTNPDSRRLMVNAWNVGELDQMVLPPCHYGFQVYTRELSIEERITISTGTLITGKIVDENVIDVWELHCKKDNTPTRAISLMWNQRSVDTFLGFPFNIASYGLLLEIIAKEVNMVPDELVGNLGDVHLYSNHIEQAKEQIGRDLTLDERFELWTNNENEYAMEEYNKLKSDCGKHDFLSNRHQGPVPFRTREPFELPTLKFSDWYKNANKEQHSSTVFNDWVESLKPEDFVIENYQSHPTIKAPLSN